MSENLAVARERGAYFTPLPVATAIAEWAIRSKTDRILDPAVGEGAFLKATAGVLRRRGAREPLQGFAGVEIHGPSFNQTRRALQELRTTPWLHRGDFFTTRPRDLGAAFDAVVGNPPYVRSKGSNSAVRARALARASEAGVDLPESSDLWAPYVVHSTRFIGSEGRLAFLLPHTLLQAAYAAPVRKFLLERFSSVTIVTLSRALFPGAQVEIVLLLADGDERRGLRLGLWDGTEPLERSSTRAIRVPQSTWLVHRHQRQADLLVKLQARDKFTELRTLATVRIGVVTGANSFFVLKPSEARERRLPGRLLRPTIAHPSLLRGVMVGASDLLDLESTDHPSRLLCVESTRRDQFIPSVASYLRRGRRLGVHTGYKTSERDRWYQVPFDPPADLLLAYMSHDLVRVAFNHAQAISTNLVHQVRLTSNRNYSKALAVALHSSVAQLSAEVRGRTYGGGVLKLEPSDAKKLLVPKMDEHLRGLLEARCDAVDKLLRRGLVVQAQSFVDEVLIAAGRLTRQEAVIASRQLRQIRAGRKARGRIHSAMARAKAQDKCVVT